jgi:ammonium transporter, Amt family
VGLTPNPDYAATIPEQTFMIYQLMFAIITPALITGAFAERMKFSAMAVFLSLWSLSSTAPWPTWSGAWAACSTPSRRPLSGRSTSPAAPSSTSPAASRRWSPASISASASAIRRTHAAPLHGAQLHRRLPAVGGLVRLQRRQRAGASPLATSAFVNTHFAAAAAAIGWTIAEWIHNGKPTALGAISGAVAGLVAITPASGFVQPMSALPSASSPASSAPSWS